MAQFRHTKFSFDGVSCDEFGLIMVNVGGGEMTRQIGLQRSLSLSENSYGKFSFDEISTETPTFTITLLKCSKNYDPQPITQEEIFKINNWLFKTKEFKPFISQDNPSIVYYGMFVGGNLWQNENNEGYLEVQFQLNAPHAYGVMQKIAKQVSGEKEFSIICKDNVNGYSLPDFEFHLQDGETEFKVENLTTGQVMSYSNLDSKSRKGYLYNEGCQHTVSLIDSTINMRPKSNGNFLKLKYGNNNIKITGNGTFIIYEQPKVALQ